MFMIVPGTQSSSLFAIPNKMKLLEIEDPV